MWAFSFRPPAFARGQLSECWLSHWLMQRLLNLAIPPAYSSNTLKPSLATCFLYFLPSAHFSWVPFLSQVPSESLGRQLWARDDILWETDTAQNYWITVAVGAAKKKCRGLRESITGESRHCLGCQWWFQMFGCIALNVCGQPFKVYDTFSHMFFSLGQALSLAEYTELHPVLETKAVGLDVAILGSTSSAT